MRPAVTDVTPPTTQQSEKHSGLTLVQHLRDLRNTMGKERRRTLNASWMAILCSVYTRFINESNRYDASTREAARVNALEEESDLVLGNFSRASWRWRLPWFWLTQGFDSLLQHKALP